MIAPRFAVFTLAAAALAAMGCDVLGPSVCDKNAADNPPSLYSQGTVAGGIYMSSPWDGPLLYFPGGRRLNLEHHLGAEPRSWAAYLAFSEQGISPVGAIDGGSLAQATGNQVLLVGMDATFIDVANDSCVPYWLLVTATAGDAPLPGPDGGSPGD